MQKMKWNVTSRMEKNSHEVSRNVRLKKLKNTGQREAKRKQIYKMMILKQIQFKKMAKIKEHKKWSRQHHQTWEEKEISLGQTDLYVLLQLQVSDFSTVKTRKRRKVL